MTLCVFNALANGFRNFRGFTEANPDFTFSFPTTISAVNRKFLPPLTTFATRLMETRRSLNSLGSFSNLLLFCMFVPP